MKFATLTIVVRDRERRGMERKKGREEEEKRGGGGDKKKSLARQQGQRLDVNRFRRYNCTSYQG